MLLNAHTKGPAVPLTIAPCVRCVKNATIPRASGQRRQSWLDHPRGLMPVPIPLRPLCGSPAWAPAARRGSRPVPNQPEPRAGPGPKRGAASCQGTSRRALLGVGCHWHANGPALSNAPCQWARAEHQKATPGQCAHVYRSAQTERAEFTTGSFPVPQWLRNHLRANRERATRPHGFSRCSSSSLPWARLFRTRRFAQLRMHRTLVPLRANAVRKKAHEDGCLTHTLMRAGS
jgi:hypothetical protein